jgi:hypothetical protein
LGFSIEGKAVERDPLNKQRVTKAKITGVAVTHMPKNAQTFADIVKSFGMEKSMEAGYDHADNTADDGVSLKEESVEGDDKQEERQESRKGLELLELIFNRYPGIDKEKAKEIFKSITTIQMSYENDEEVQKAIELLDEAEGLVKGGDDDDDKTMQMAKAMKRCGQLMDKGMKKADCVKKMVQEGYPGRVAGKAYGAVLEKMAHADDDYEKANKTPSEFNRRNGDTDPATKDEKMKFDNIAKSFENLSKEFSQKTQSTAVILKGIYDDVSNVVEENNNLKKANGEILEAVKNQQEQNNSLFDLLKSMEDEIQELRQSLSKSNMPKSKRRSTTRPVDRFNKGFGGEQDNVVSVSDYAGTMGVLEKAFNEGYDREIGGTLSTFEITKGQAPISETVIEKVKNLTGKTLMNQ